MYVQGQDLIKLLIGSSLGVQWLGLCTFTAKGVSSIPGWGAKIPQGLPRGKKKKVNIYCSSRTFFSEAVFVFFSL